MALSFWVFSTWFPLPVAVLLALCTRLFLTGALHDSTDLGADATGKAFSAS